MLPKGCIHLSNDALAMPTALRRRLVRKALENLKGNSTAHLFSHVQAATDLIIGNVEGRKDLSSSKRYPGPPLSKFVDFGQAVDKAPITPKSHKKKLPPATTIPFPLPAAIRNLEMGVGLRFTFHRPGSAPVG
jgi:hypothetical protein